MKELLSNQTFIWCGMALIIFLVTQVLKLPIKYLTNKISNERIRKITNATILIIPFCLGVLFEFLYKTYYLHDVFNAITGLSYGAAGISLYGVIERFFKIKVNNPYESEEGETVLEIIENVSKDGKLDNEDAGEAVKKFLDMVNKNE